MYSIHAVEEKSYLMQQPHYYQTILVTSC